jgi:hypothetical protein
MSQSDYLKYKRITQELTDAESLDKMPRTTTNDQYIAYKGFTVVNSVWSKINTFHKYVPDHMVDVFGMQKDILNNDCLFANYRNCGKVTRPNVNMDNSLVISNTARVPTVKPNIKLVKWNTPDRVTIPPKCDCRPRI